MAANVAGIIRPSAIDQLTCLDNDKCNKFMAQCVTPGESVICDEDCMRGHGIVKQTNETDGSSSTREACAAVAGRIEQINKLISVAPIRSAYIPAVGDVVVGRIIEIVAHAHRWVVDIRATRNAILQLASVNLPGNEVRRRGREDASTMRSMMREGDLIVAEVQSVHEDGQPNLHARSERYGRLSNAGRLLRVPFSLVKRTKAHFHTLPNGGVQMLIGTNGFIWLGATTNQLDLLLGPESQSTSGFDQKSHSAGEYYTDATYEPYPAVETESLESAINVDSSVRLALNADVREMIARASICIELLAKGGVAFSDSTVLSALECSARVGDGSVRQFAIEPRRAVELIRLVRERLVFESAANDRMDSV